MSRQQQTGIKTAIKHLLDFSLESEKAIHEMSHLIEHVKFIKKHKVNYFGKMFNPKILLPHIFPPCVTFSINRYIFSLEAIVADLYRFMGGPDFTPKVRIILGNPNSFPEKANIVGLASKEIKAFQPAAQLENKNDEVKKILTSQEKQLACLFVSCYVLEEADLHGYNWGTDNQNNSHVVKIDHDMSVPKLASQLADFDYKELHWCLDPPSMKEEEIKQNFEQLQKLPNLIYKPEEYFDLISHHDILNLPSLIDAAPYNWPTYKGKFSDPDTLKTIKNSPGFQTWVFFYFTKALFLNKNIITMIANDHSPYGYACEKEALITHLDKKIKKLKAVLLDLPEFRKFLKLATTPSRENKKNYLKILLSEEIEEYNLEFKHTKTKDQKPKHHRRHRIINLTEVEAFLCNLCKESEQKTEKDTPLHQNKIKLSQLKERLKRQEKIKGRLEYYKNNPRTPSEFKNFLDAHITKQTENTKMTQTEINAIEAEISTTTIKETHLIKSKTLLNSQKKEQQTIEKPSQKQQEQHDKQQSKQPIIKSTLFAKSYPKGESPPRNDDDQRNKNNPHKFKKS